MATTVNASVTGGGKTINLVIEDIAAIGAAVAAATGKMGAAQLIALIGRLVDSAIAGYNDGATVVIDADSIAALLQNVPLDPPGDANPGPGH